MRLKKLRLKNFKGIRSFELSPNGGNVSIYGENATGKTTLKDAFFWLLFDKDGQGKSEFDIKTIDPKTGEAIHNLDHKVEGTLELNGKDITLKKVYYEKWTRQRGNAEKSFTGHTTDYFIDGVPVKKSEYDARISEIAGRDDIFKLLTDPAYFNEQLHWQERRKILLEVCGDISDADVIASNEKLARLQDILTERSLEDHRKILQARKKEINKELERIPVRIDEVSQGLPDISSIQPEKVKSEIENLKQQKQEKETELVRLQNGGEIAEKIKQLREIESELLRIQNDHAKDLRGNIDETQNALDLMLAERRALQAELADIQQEIDRNSKNIAEWENDMARLRKEWRNTDSLMFKFEQSDTCPTCGQKLPQEKLQEARDKALADFNQEKAAELELITKHGKEYRKLVDETQKVIEANKGEIEKIQKDILPIEEDIKELQEKIKVLQAQRTDISENKEYQAKDKERQQLEEQIEFLKGGVFRAAEQIEADMDSLNETMIVHQDSLAQVEQHKKGKARIEELKAQEKELVKEYEKLEKELYLLEEFTKRKVSLLEEKINSKFKLARFKLFNTLVNGRIEECCETIYDGVPYSTALNNGMRKNIGIDIINTLSEHYKFSAPIWFDNREAVTELIPTNGQLINLVVSEKDKSLRVEQKNK